MSANSYVSKVLCLSGALLIFSAGAFAQGLTAQGGEFSLFSGRAGDQVLPSLSLSMTAGCVAWQDSLIDKQGLGVGAALLDGVSSAETPFRVNRVVTGRQIKPQVQLLANNNVVFVWQGSVTLTSPPNIYARFCRDSSRDAASIGTNFYTGDRQVNTYIADQQVDPAVAALPDGSAIVTWSSYGQDGSLWGVYARRITAQGGVIAADNNGSPKQFLVNQYTTGSQRNPSVAVLANGNYVISWVSEAERGPNRIDIYARIFSPTGTPVTDELPINSGTNVCNNPSIAASLDGGFAVVWAQRDSVYSTNGWDVWGRTFSAAGTPETNDQTINTFLYGDQYLPKIAVGASGDLVVWTSLGQDGSREGVYGQYLTPGFQPSGTEFRVNTTTISQQMHPAVAWNGLQFLVIWTSFAGSSGFDLYGQAYSVSQ